MDVVEQLRSIGCNSPQGCAADGKPNHICRCIIQNEAADEIERLREALKEVRRVSDYPNDVEAICVAALQQKESE